MNGLVKGVIIFGLGFSSGYYIAKRKLEVKYATLAQEEIDSVRERLNKRSRVIHVENEDSDYPEIVVVNEDDVDSEIFKDMTEEEIQEAKEHHERVISGFIGSKVNYGNYYKPENFKRDEDEEDAELSDDQYNEHEVYDEENAELSDGETLGRVDRETPYLIDEAEYDINGQHYDKLELFYYDEDGVVCDGDDRIIEDVEDICGLDVFGVLEMQTTAWARNEVVGSDYVVYRVSGSYARDIAGVAETPSEREYRILSRKKTIMDGE